jgi:NAD(P)-dependent dehydrogenase (short-subunit alcohol dehydrogenase family)
MAFKRKVVIITGASRGIGAALVKRFRELEYGIVGTARSVVSSQAGSDSETLMIAGDIGERDTAVRVVEVTMERFGRIDTLINNAGIFIPKPFLEYSVRDFTAIIGVNLAGFFHISQLAASRMLQAGAGHIINISAAIARQPLLAVPTALTVLTKGGLDAVTHALSIEFAARGVRVNAVSPGVVRTSMHRPEALQAFTALQPMGRVGETEDIVDAVTYLEQAPFVTGANLRVDGGAFTGGGSVG